MARAIERQTAFAVIPWQMGLAGRMLSYCRAGCTTGCSRMRRTSRATFSKKLP